MEKNRCCGKTKENKNCRRSPMTGTKYCYSHKDVLINAFNEECPICFEKDGKMIILSCHHAFHEECCKGHADLNCPVCRQPVTNWSRYLKKNIESNINSRAEELEEEDRQNIINQQEEIDSFQQLPQTEILLAMQYLREIDIPLEYIPQDVYLSFRRNQPDLRPGILFSMIVNTVMEKIQEDIEFDLTDEDTSDEDNPFEEKNQRSMEQFRSVRIDMLD